MCLLEGLNGFENHCWFKFVMFGFDATLKIGSSVQCSCFKWPLIKHVKKEIQMIIKALKRSNQFSSCNRCPTDSSLIAWLLEGGRKSLSKFICTILVMISILYYIKLNYCNICNCNKIITKLTLSIHFLTGAHCRVSSITTVNFYIWYKINNIKHKEH